MDKMDKIVVKVVISLVLGFLLSFLIAPFESMRSAIGETISSVIAWIVMIALFVVIDLIAGQWVRRAMPGIVGTIGSVVFPAAAAVVLIGINAWIGGVAVRLIHMIACAGLVYAIDHKFGKKK